MTLSLDELYLTSYIYGSNISHYLKPNSFANSFDIIPLPQPISAITFPLKFIPSDIFLNYFALC